MLRIILFIAIIFGTFCYGEEKDVATATEAEAIKATIARLGSNEFSERESAFVELQKFGTLAAPQLREVQSQDVEVRKSVGQLLSLCPPVRIELPGYYDANMNVYETMKRLYLEWAAEETRIAEIDWSTVRFVGIVPTNSHSNLRDMARIFRFRPDATMEAIELLRKENPQEKKVEGKNGDMRRLSPARFLMRLAILPSNDSQAKEAASRVLAAAEKEAPPNANEWQMLRKDILVVTVGERVSMVMKEASLIDAVSVPAEIGKLRLFFESKELFNELKDRRISIRLENNSPEAALAEILKGTEIEYAGRGINRYAVVRRAKK